MDGYKYVKWENGGQMKKQTREKVKQHIFWENWDLGELGSGLYGNEEKERVDAAEVQKIQIIIGIGIPKRYGNQTDRHTDGSWESLTHQKLRRKANK